MGAVHEGQRSFEGVGDQLGPERLAGVGRHDHQRLALEVEFLVLFGIDPCCDPLNLGGGGLSDRFDF